MADWTTGEVRRLKEMHANGKPSMAAMFAAFDRHPPKSVYNMAIVLGLRGRPDTLNPAHHWLRVAHEYFARRESGLLA